MNAEGPIFQEGFGYIDATHSTNGYILITAVGLIATLYTMWLKKYYTRSHETTLTVSKTNKKKISNFYVKFNIKIIKIFIAIFYWLNIQLFKK